MKIERKTIIDQIEVARNGTVQVRFAILVLADGVEIASQWHRTAILPGIDPDAQIDAVDADITTRAEIRAVPIDRGRMPLLKAICRAVAAHRAKLEHPAFPI